MDPSPLFLRIRMVAFSCINFFSFLLIVLYCVVISFQWDVMVRSERALLSVMLIVNIITLITLLILLLLEFRIWLDVARMCALLIAQLGISGVFAYWRPQFGCEEKIGDQQGVCDIISLCVLVTSWITPLLLLIYLVGLLIMAYRRRCIINGDNAQVVTSPGHLNTSRSSLLPIMTAYQTPVTLTFPPEVHNKPRHSMHTQRSAISTSYFSPPATPTSVNPGRLSKRSPLVDLV